MSMHRDDGDSQLTNPILAPILGREDLPMSLKTTRVARLLRWALGLLAALWLPGLAFAQNCALCYSQAAGGGARLIQALRSGILILVIPPMAICVGLTVMAYRKRNQFNED